ncbi:hypothetical protein V8C86DRAFT_2431788 [Haematococcus lacustris]
MFVQPTYNLPRFDRFMALIPYAKKPWPAVVHFIARGVESCLKSMNVKEEILNSVCEFLEGVTHVVLHTKSAYPKEAFERCQLFGSQFFRCRHPDVTMYISTAMEQLKPLLRSSSIPELAIVFFNSAGAAVQRLSIQIEQLVLDQSPQLVDLQGFTTQCANTLTKLQFLDNFAQQTLPQGASGARGATGPDMRFWEEDATGATELRAGATPGGQGAGARGGGIQATPFKTLYVKDLMRVQVCAGCSHSAHIAVVQHISKVLSDCDTIRNALQCKGPSPPGPGRVPHSEGAKGGTKGVTPPAGVISLTKGVKPSLCSLLGGGEAGRARGSSSSEAGGSGGREASQAGSREGEKELTPGADIGSRGDSKSATEASTNKERCSPGVASRPGGPMAGSSGVTRVQASATKVEAVGTPCCAPTGQGPGPESKRFKAAGQELPFQCMACGRSNRFIFLLRCEACSNACHLACCQPPLTSVPKGKWFCSCCQPLAQLHDIERLLDAQPPQHLGTQQQTPPHAAGSPAGPSCCGAGWECNWARSRSYRHCTWLPEKAVEDSFSRVPGLKGRLARFWAQRAEEGEQADDDGEGEEGAGEFLNGVNSQWTLVDRIIAERAVQPGQGKGAVAGAAEPSFLVKWRELGYEQCTWEAAAELKEFEEEVAAFRARTPIVADAQARALVYTAQQRLSQSQPGSAPGPTSPTPGSASTALPLASLSEDPGGPGQAALGSRKFSSTPDWLRGGQLHGYQLEGLNWLFHKWSSGDNVILADEAGGGRQGPGEREGGGGAGRERMGLGKTVQAIALLAALHAVAFVPRPSLLVVPLSTLRNWEREFKTWAPHLNVVTLNGNAAARKTILEHELLAPPVAGQRKTEGRCLPWPPRQLAPAPCCVLWCSYEMLVAEAGPLCRSLRLEWEVLVVDEGHRLKNKDSRLFQELKAFK